MLADAGTAAVLAVATYPPVLLTDVLTTAFLAKITLPSVLAEARSAAVFAMPALATVLANSRAPTITTVVANSQVLAYSRTWIIHRLSLCVTDETRLC